MKTGRISPLLAITALVFSNASQAASVWLQPSSSLVTPGSSLTVDLMLNAADAPGSHPGLYGGEVVVDFDPALLAYGGLTLAPGVTFFSSPVVGSSGNRQTVTFGFENAADVSRVGTFSYTVTGGAGSGATVNVADADEFFGTFIAYLPSNQPFYPEFAGTSVQIVPLPGTSLLMLSALTAAATRARRVARSRLWG